MRYEERFAARNARFISYLIPHNSSLSSKPRRMPRREASRHARVCVPARTLGAARAGRVQAQAGDHGESVAVARINGDPPPVSTLTETHEAARIDRRIERSRVVQRERHGARAVVAAVVERA